MVDEQPWGHAGALLCVALAAVACGPSAPPAAVVQVTSATPAPSTPTPLPLGRCGKPPPPSSARRPPAPALCRPVARGEASAVKRDLKRRHRPGDPGTSLDADIRCDPLGDRIVEISVEQGSAHGWSLALWRLVRRGESFAATRIGFHGRYNAGDPQTYAAAERFDVALERGEVDAARVDSSLYRVRASLLATAREVGGAAPVGSAAAVPTAPVASSSASARPPSVGNSGVGAPTASSSGRSSWATSESFVTGVRLVDAEGRVLERWFAGNEEAEAQPAYLPIQLAEAALAPALEAVTRGEGEPGPTDRRFFVDRFRAARARFLDPRFPPWTRQAYVALAGQLGTSELVPALIELGVADRDERTRYHAVNALVTLTGWDPRSDDASRPRPASDVAADFARECRP